VTQRFDGFRIFGFWYFPGEHLPLELANLEEVQIAYELISQFRRRVVARIDAVPRQLVQHGISVLELHPRNIQ